MNAVPLIPVVVMCLVLVAAVVRLLRAPAGPRTDLPPSLLAKDGGQGGVGFLLTKDGLRAAHALRSKRGVR